MKAFHPEKRPKELDMGDSKQGQDEDLYCLQQFPCCPACSQKYNIALILPCSHTMCGHCVAAGEGTRSSLRRGLRQSVCSVLCPCCQHAVELPCWTWSSATSCLPKHPTLKSEETDGKEVGKDGETEQSSSYCFSAATSSVIPLDGAINLQEEDMEQSVFGLNFALDPSTLPPSLRLSNSSLTVTHHGRTHPTPSSENKNRKSTMSCDPGDLLHVRADVVIARGQYYWEVDVCNSSIYRIGVISSDGSVGWWLQRYDLSFFAVYDGCCEPLCNIPPQIKTIGIFLNIGGGTLSFHNPLTQEHLATLPTCFSPAGVLPALGLGQGKLRLRCGLPPPPHVFLSKDSAYSGLHGSCRGGWRGEVPFQSVRKVIQKFEKLALSDSDSGLVSSFGSSCSTLASLPDAGFPSFPSGHTGQEALAD